VCAGLFANAPLYKGPFVNLIGGGDASVFVGMLAAGIVYYALAAAGRVPEGVMHDAEPAANMPSQGGNRMSAHDEWFVVQNLGDGIHLLAEPPHVNSFLITGTQRAVLFDTGLGIANIRKVAEEITDLDILVVNSHYHFDHSGGNHLFSQIAIHELGAAALAEEVPAEWLTMYMDYTARMLDNFRIYRELDDAFFHLVDLEMFPPPAPIGLRPQDMENGPHRPEQAPGRRLRPRPRLPFAAGHPHARTYSRLHLPP
jgi:hypothetical protein